MLVREHSQGSWLITQPTHAWVAGQLALAWGNTSIPAPKPRDDVVLGAILHDIGWLNWEVRPTWNPATRLPHTFMQLPTGLHLDIWEPASRLALPFGRYAALLVSLHGSYLYGFHNYDRGTPEEAMRARAFIDREREFQNACITSLRADAKSHNDASEEVIECNRRLVALWDGMSLAICGNSQSERSFSFGSDAELRVIPSADGFQVDPWPFSTNLIEMRVDGRPVSRDFSDQHDLDEWMLSSSLASINIRLLPGN